MGKKREIERKREREGEKSERGDGERKKRPSYAVENARVYM